MNKENITFEDVKKAKLDTEKTISAALLKLSRETGLEVLTIELTPVKSLGIVSAGETVAYSVDILAKV